MKTFNTRTKDLFPSQPCSPDLYPRMRQLKEQTKTEVQLAYDTNSCGRVLRGSSNFLFEDFRYLTRSNINDHQAGSENALQYQ